MRWPLALRRRQIWEVGRYWAEGTRQAPARRTNHTMELASSRAGRDLVREAIETPKARPKGRPGPAWASCWPCAGRTSTSGRGLTFGAPKTPGSRRLVALSPETRNVLKEHRRRQLKHRLKMGPAYRDQALVFASSTGQPTDDTNLRRAFARVVRTAGLEHLRIHDLRQTVGHWRHKTSIGGVEPPISYLGPGRGGGIRTPDLRFWRPLLFQAELHPCPWPGYCSQEAYGRSRTRLCN